MVAGAVRAGGAYVELFADKRRLNKQMRRLRQDFQTAGRGFNQALAVAGVAGGLGAVVAQSVKLAAANEQLAISYRVLAGDADTAASLIKDLRQFAAETPFETNEILAAGKSLLAFGFTAEQIRSQLWTLGNVSAATGTRFGELAEIVGKMRVQGRIFSEDLNQLTGRGINVLDGLAERFNTTAGEVKQFAADGKISFDDLNAVLTDLGQNKWGDLMAEQAETAAGKWSTLKSTITEIQTELGELIIQFDELASKAVLGGDSTGSFLKDLNRGLKVMRDPVGELTDPIQEARQRQEEEFQFMQRQLAARRRERQANQGPMGRFTGAGGGLAAVIGEVGGDAVDFGKGASGAFMAGLTGIKDQFMDVAPIVGENIANKMQIAAEQSLAARDERLEAAEEAQRQAEQFAPLTTGAASFRADERASGAFTVEQQQLDTLVQIANNTQPLAGGV